MSQNEDPPEEKDKVPDFYEDPIEKGKQEMVKRINRIFDKHDGLMLDSMSFAAYMYEEQANPESTEDPKLVAEAVAAATLLRVEFLMMEILSEIRATKGPKTK